MSRVSALYRLQEVDLQLDQRHGRVSALDAELANNQIIRALHQRALDMETQVKTARVNQRTFEYDIQALNAKIGELEKQLYGGGVSNTKELQDLQKDVEAQRRHRATLEEKQFDALMQVETAEIDLAKTLDDLTRAEAETATHHAHLTEEREQLAAQIAHLEEDREVAAVSVPRADQELYAQIRQAKKGLAVTRLTEGVCATCGVEPTSSQMQTVRQGLELMQCPNCERILYAE